MWKIVIPDRQSTPAEIEQKIFGNRGKVVCLNAKNNSEMYGKIEDADAILAWHDLSWDKEVIQSLKNCKVIVRVGTGFDNIDLDEAKSRGIIVCNVPDYGTNDVADHTVMLLLATARGLMGYNQSAKESPGGWKWGVAPAFRLTNKILGVIGLGRIGCAVALRAKSFGMNVGFYDPYLPQGWQKTLGLNRYTSLDELARASDVVSIHTPLTAETTNMLDRKFWQKTKKGVVFINTGRGSVFNWPDFVEAFQAEHISAAAFDVLPQEPLNPSDPLLKKWIEGDPNLQRRLIITPHCAFYCPEAVEEMREKAALEALRILKGEKPFNQVNA